MTRDHCNVCDKTPAQNKRRVWPNTLPEGHPLQNIALDVTINPSSRHHVNEEEFHLCEDCFNVLLDAIAGNVKKEDLTVAKIALIKLMPAAVRKEVALAAKGEQP